MIDLTSAPEGATHYIEDIFYRQHRGVWLIYINSIGWFYCHESKACIGSQALPITPEWTAYNNDKPLSELAGEPRNLLLAMLCDGYPMQYKLDDKWEDRPKGPKGNSLINTNSIYRAKQKSERELFIDVAKKSASLRARDGAETIYGELFDAGFKAPNKL